MKISERYWERKQNNLIPIRFHRSQSQSNSLNIFQFPSNGTLLKSKHLKNVSELKMLFPAIDAVFHLIILRCLLLCAFDIFVWSKENDCHTSNVITRMVSSVGGSKKISTNSGSAADVNMNHVFKRKQRNLVFIHYFFSVFI